MYQTFITLKIHLYEISSFVKLLLFLQSAVLYQSSNSVVGVGLSEFSLNGPSSGSHYTLFPWNSKISTIISYIYTRGECWWAPVSSRQKKNNQIINMVRLWNRLIKLDNNKIIKQFFIWDKNLNNERSWNHQLISIFESTNMINIYQNTRICDIQQFIVI